MITVTRGLELEKLKRIRDVEVICLTKTCSNCGHYRYPEIKLGKIVPGCCRMTGKDEVRLQRTVCVAWCKRNNSKGPYLKR